MTYFIALGLAILTWDVVATLYHVRCAARAHEAACKAFVEATKIGGAFGPRRTIA